MAIVVPIIAKFIDDGLKDAKEEFGAAQGWLKKTESALDSLAGPAKAVVAGVAGAGLAVAKNAGGALKANKKLAASFAAVGYDKNAAAAMAYADTLQHVIGVSDEEIQATMQKLTAFDKVAASQDFMARATQGAADMSAAGFGSMEGAATALGKALQHPEKNLGALTRMGVTFTKQQKKQIEGYTKSGQEAQAMNLILQEVEGTFGGVAEASAGGTDKMKLAWDEAAETIGTTLVPILGILNAVLTKVANFAAEHSKAFLILAGVIGGLASALLIANAAFKAYAIGVKIAGVATKAFGLILKLAGGWIGILVGAIVLAVVLIIKNWDKVKAATMAVWNWIKGYLDKIWNGIKKAASATWDAIKKVIDVAWRLIKGILSLNPFVFILKHCEWAQDIVRKAWDFIKSIIKRAWDGIKSIFNSNPFTKIQGWLTTLKGWIGSAFDWIKDKISGVWDFVSNIVGDIQRAVDKAKDAVSKIPVVGKRMAGRDKNATAAALTSQATMDMVRGVPVPQAQTVATRQGGGAGPTVNVFGALDPDAVGRQIKRLLENQDTRQGRLRGAPRRVAW